MRLLLDVNVILDHFLERDSESAASSKVIALCGEHHDAFIAWHSLSILTYLVSKEWGSKQRTTKLIEDLLEWSEVAAVDSKSARRALELEFDDFEDALQAAAAEAAGAEVIITRNVKDFAASPIPAYSANRFLAEFHPDLLANS